MKVGPPLSDATRPTTPAVDGLVNSSLSPLPPRRSRFAAALDLVRWQHWSKNAFVIAPLFFAMKLGDVDAVVAAIGAFVTFSLTASAVYVVNDWFDRLEDADHPVKRRRPLASGELRGRDALTIGAVCMVGAASAGLSVGLPPAFWATVGAYVAMNFAYSIGLRHLDLIDVCIIASGFVLRVLAGTTAIGVSASQWIVLATGLLALLLALGKRRTDLAQESARTRRSLDGYTVEFIDTALATLAAAVIGFYAMFTLSDYSQERFRSDDLYLTTFLVALGTIRYLQVVIAHGRLGSPTEIALMDRPLQLIVAAWLGSFFLLSSVIG